MLGYYGLHFEEKPMSSERRTVSAYSEKAEKLVNKHLYFSSQKQDWASKQRQAENDFMAPRIGDSLWPKVPTEKKDYGVDHSPDTHEQNAFNDLNRYQKDVRATNPDYIIQNQLNDEARTAEYKELSKQEYVAQFIENARRNGYEVRVNGDFVVTSVRKIRPEGPSLFGDPGRNPTSTGAE